MGIRLGWFAAPLLAVIGMAAARPDPIASQDIDIVDGDTFAVNGKI